MLIEVFQGLAPGFLSYPRESREGGKDDVYDSHDGSRRQGELARTAAIVREAVHEAP